MSECIEFFLLILLLLLLFTQTTDVFLPTLEADSLPPLPPSLTAPAPAPTDLFSAHNFDINIDLPNNTTGE